MTGSQMKTLNQLVQRSHGIRSAALNVAALGFARFATATLATLLFQAAPAAELPYPRLANFYNSEFKAGASTETLDALARYHLLVATFKGDVAREVAYVKRKNPQAIVLHYISVRGQSPNNPLMKDDYWLISTTGQRVEPWPNRSLPNQTRPEVNDVMIAMAREALQRVPQFDGIFLDSYYRYIAHLNKGDLDADRDGRRDDPKKLNAAWVEGLLRVARGIRALRPNLIVMANGGAPIDFGYEDLNGVLFEDQLFYLEKRATAPTEGRQRTADDLLAAYQKWESVPHTPHVTAFVDGGGEVANPWEWNKLTRAEREPLVEQSRHNERRMRFNLCFTLMGDGYAAFDYHTTSRGQLWWYPEWDPKLDRPREPAQKRDGFWRREFGGATVYVNPFAQTATVPEYGGFTLPAFDGKIVPRAKPEP